MILKDFSNIKIGNSDISAVYAGAVKIWPAETSGGTGDRRTMRFTIVSGDTWNNTTISAYTVDDRLIQPTEKTATGWTYAEEVEYLNGSNAYSKHFNLNTFEGFDGTVKIKNGTGFFMNNAEATGINCSRLDTSMATDMYRMFKGCPSLASLDLSHFDTSNVTDMSSMFSFCGALTTLDVSRFDTSKVKYMSGMFEHCVGLTSLNLSNFDTSKVEYMDSMFFNCKALTSLDLSNWDTSKATSNTSNNSMFTNCVVLKIITMKNCTTSTVNKIKAALDAAGITANVTIITA